MSTAQPTPAPFDFDTIVLKFGAHEPNDGEFCFLEAVAVDSGEKKSDKPSTVCTTIQSLTRTYNDRCGLGAAADARRTRVLGPLRHVVQNTRGSRELAQRRAWMSADWGCRVALPQQLRLVPQLAAWADRLEALAPIVDVDSRAKARSLMFELSGVAWTIRSEAWASLREKFADADAAAVAVADAVAVAVADAVAAADAAAAAAADAAAAAVAVADAVADAVAAAVSGAVAVAAAVSGAVAGAVAAAVAGADADAVADAAADAYAGPWRKVFEAAVGARKVGGGGYSECYHAARKVAAELEGDLVSPKFFALRDELGVEFQGLVRRMAALTEGHK